MLAPIDQVISLWNRDADDDTNLDNLRKKLKISRLVAIIRAYHLGLITTSDKDRYYSDEMGRIIAAKKKDQEKPGGPDPHLMRRYKTGRNLALAVLSEVASGQMLYRDAFSLLGVKNRAGLKEFAECLGYYSFDIAPGFWRWLELLAEEQGVLTVKAVREEIIDGNDALCDWISDLPKGFFAEPDIPVQENLRKIVNLSCRSRDLQNTTVMHSSKKPTPGLLPPR